MQGSVNRGSERFYGGKQLRDKQYYRKYADIIYKRNTQIKLSDFCTANSISDAAFRKWLRQYETGGIEALARADSTVPDVWPEGVDRTEESYKREILKLRIENERLKKNYLVETNENGERVYVRLKEKSTK